MSLSFAKRSEKGLEFLHQIFLLPVRRYDWLHNYKTPFNPLSIFTSQFVTSERNMKNILLLLFWNVSGKWLEDYEFEFENFNVYDFLREGTNSYRIQVNNRTDSNLLMADFRIFDIEIFLSLQVFYPFEIFVRAKKVCLLLEMCLLWACFLWVCLLWVGTVLNSLLIVTFSRRQKRCHYFGILSLFCVKSSGKVFCASGALKFTL